jgi:hypothetical protein
LIFYLFHSSFLLPEPLQRLSMIEDDEDQYFKEMLSSIFDPKIK